MYTVSGIMSNIYEWSLPEQPPATRMFLTRLGGLACVVIESKAIVETSWNLLKTLFSNPRPVLNQMIRLIIGLVSTIIIGIAFSPAINYRIHSYLGLTVNDFLAHREKQSKLLAERQASANEAEKKRQAHLDRLEMECYSPTPSIV